MKENDSLTMRKLYDAFEALLDDEEDEMDGMFYNRSEWMDWEMMMPGHWFTSEEISKAYKERQEFLGIRKGRNCFLLLPIQYNGVLMSKVE